MDECTLEEYVTANPRVPHGGLTDRKSCHDTADCDPGAHTKRVRAPFTRTHIGWCCNVYCDAAGLKS